MVRAVPSEKRADPIEFQITRSDGEVRTLAVTAEIICRRWRLACTPLRNDSGYNR